MKKQIITIISVAVAAVLLFTVYSVFFRNTGIEVTGDSFYTLTTETQQAVSGIDTEVRITLSGYDGADDGWETISRYARVIAEANSNITIKTKSAGEAEVSVATDSGEKDIPYESFFKTRYDGTRYAFDGEALMVNAILSLCGKGELEIELRAFSGYDTDGDTVTATGAPFMFDSIDRSKIAFLTINNSHGTYSIYQDEGSFFFTSTRAAAYDDELFSQLTTNCRYMVTYGKFDLPEGKSWASYGLEIDNGSKAETASYSLMTTSDSDGNYFLHSVYIGSLASSGTYYYARYVGGLFAPSGKEGEADTLIYNLTKDVIYQIPADSVQGTIDAPQTDVMTATLVNSITDSEELLTIDNVRIDDYKSGISAFVRNLYSFNPAANMSVKDSSAITSAICDKVSAKEYSSYEGGWLNNIGVFGGFTSSDGKATHMDALLTRYAQNGEYRIKFGILRDEENGACLPGNITFSKSADGVNWIAIENGTVRPEQSDKTVKEYELSFTDTERVKFIRIAFDVPQVKSSYVVFDEIRIYADGDDSQPKDSISGVWNLMSPEAYIPTGSNVTSLDMNNFNNFIQSIAAIEGERVVACGFGKDGDASTLNTELLAKYGLDNPEKHFSFEYQEIITDIYVSAPNGEGKYYAYSVFTGELNGERICATTDIIVELSTATAEWLEWSFTEYLDHSLLSIYIIDMTDMTLSFDGKDYKFDITLDENGGDLAKVSYNGQSMDVKSLKYIYQAILSIYMQDEYVPSENDKPEEYLRIKISTETNSPELVFYRVSASKCYFTVNGEGSYYALVEDVNLVRDVVLRYISGEIITREDVN